MYKWIDAFSADLIRFLAICEDSPGTLYKPYPSPRKVTFLAIRRQSLYGPGGGKSSGMLRRSDVKFKEIKREMARRARAKKMDTVRFRPI